MHFDFLNIYEVKVWAGPVHLYGCCSKATIRENLDLYVTFD